MTSTSKVESTHTTNDFHKLTWELVEGEVVESRIDNVSGAFATEAVLISSSKTDIVGSSNLDLSGSSISSFSDTEFENRSETTTTLTTEQSGMYGSSGSSVSSSKVSSKTVAETLTKFSTDSESKTAYDGWSQTTDYETSSSTITEFSSSESFSDKDGDKASWSSSYDYESDWSYDYDYTNGGYAISLSDSGGDSWSESSGEQTYTPPEEGNPNNNYNGRVRTFGGGDDDGQSQGNEEAIEQANRRAQTYLAEFVTPTGDLIYLPPEVLLYSSEIDLHGLTFVRWVTEADLNHEHMVAQLRAKRDAEIRRRVISEKRNEFKSKLKKHGHVVFYFTDSGEPAPDWITNDKRVMRISAEDLEAILGLEINGSRTGQVVGTANDGRGDFFWLGIGKMLQEINPKTGKLSDSDAFIIDYVLKPLFVQTTADSGEEVLSLIGFQVWGSAESFQREVKTHRHLMAAGMHVQNSAEFGLMLLGTKFALGRSNSIVRYKGMQVRVSPNHAAHNAANFAKYLDEMRVLMAKPHVSDPVLASYMNELYREGATIGSGSTAAAVRHELATGAKVGGRLHTQKAQDMVKALQKWLRGNPNASASDRAAAENVLKDLLNALNGR